MDAVEKPEGRIVIYSDPKGKSQIDLIAKGGTVWMTQRQMGELFQKDSDTIGLHIINILQEAELQEDRTTEKNSVVRQEGNRKVNRTITFYNLDMIISVGYRVNSAVGTRFRQWASEILKEYIVKGFAMDDARLSGERKGYFEELYERVRGIRLSEKNFYEKIKDIFAATSMDYNSKSEIAQHFLAAIQNMFHYAIHQHTAAELIADRADATKPKMGLVSWKAEDIKPADVQIAKNYLSEFEIKQLELLSEGFLAFAELKALEKTEMQMKIWAKKLIDFLELNDRPILQDRGKMTSDKAKEYALKQFSVYDNAKKEELKKLEAHLNSEATPSDGREGAETIFDQQ